MKLVLVRHAIAEEREDFAQTGEPDEKRPLTMQGRKKMQRAALGLREVVEEIDVLVSSPLVRAWQTAQIISDAFGDPPPASVDALIPDAEFDTFADWLTRLDDARTVVAVGHEPHLSSLAAWMLTGNAHPLFEFKKGGAALLEFIDEIQPGAATLWWLLTPAQLRALGA